MSRARCSQSTVTRRYLAVDPVPQRAYLADTDTSSLLAFSVPAEVFQ